MGAAAATASAAGSPERGRHTPPGHGKCRDEWKEVSTVIRGISQVVLEVEDKERAKGFWTETLGFELTQDAPYGEERWLEVRTPDKAVTVVLYTDDLQQTHKELAARGVQFPVPPVQQPFGWWSIFEDPDGNRFALVPRGQ